jgi:hypothetical protein
VVASDELAQRRELVWHGSAGVLKHIERQGEEALRIGLKNGVGVAVIKWNTAPDHRVAKQAWHR